MPCSQNRTIIKSSKQDGFQQDLVREGCAYTCVSTDKLFIIFLSNIMEVGEELAERCISEELLFMEPCCVEPAVPLF